MKGMKQLLWSCSLIASLSVDAQDIQFSSDPQTAMTFYAEQVPRSIGYCVDSLRIDTVYTEDIATGELDTVIQHYPLARYEFYLDDAMYRRIDIAEQNITDTLYTDCIEPLTTVISFKTDIPNGAYHEFFPNGNIRIKGTLDGYNPDGTLKKTGEWLEWNADGQVIRRENYP